MSFLNEVINQVDDEVRNEELQERVAIVQHKIKFMEKVSVACLDTENHLNFKLEHIINEAGGVLQPDLTQARVLIYTENGAGIMGLMGRVPSLLQQEWPAVTYNRVYLLDDEAAAAATAEALVSLLEDIAEMLYPGSFIFGNEGTRWSSFGV